MDGPIGDGSEEDMVRAQGILDDQLPGWEIVEPTIVPDPAPGGGGSAALQALRDRYRSFRANPPVPAAVLPGEIVVFKIRPRSDPAYEPRTVIFSVDRQRLIGWET